MDSRIGRESRCPYNGFEAPFDESIKAEQKTNLNLCGGTILGTKAPTNLCMKECTYGGGPTNGQMLHTAIVQYH